MDNEETMVEMNDGFEAADTPEGEIIEETGEPEESVESFAEAEEESAKADEQPVKQGTSEPGYVQKRIDKAVARALAAERENIRAEYEQQFAPLKERLIEMDARDLVQRGVVKDMETAKELVRYRQGQPRQEQEPASQPRQQNGQYAQKSDPVQEAQINLLTQQAVKIRNRTGVDVIAIMDSDPDIKDGIVSGEIDFYDVLEKAQKEPAQAKRKAPAPMRSPNGATGHSPNAIESMSDEQFRRMEKKISEGARYALK